MSIRWTVPAVVLLAVAGAAVPAGPAAAANPTVLTVTSIDDTTSGTACPATDTAACTLRTAVADAVAGSGQFLIDFAVPGPLSLTGGSLQVTGGDIVISGGPGLLTIHGANDRVFYDAGSGTKLTLENLVITGGDSSTAPSDDGFGGAIDVNTGAALDVFSSVITGNTAGNNAGAIDDNTTSAVNIGGTTISGNSAGGFGGAIDTNTGANITIVNSTIAANTSAAGGGAIDVVTGATVSLINDTIAGNQAGAPGPTAPGGILAAANSSLTVTNTVLSGNTAPACAGAGLTDGGHNAEEGTTCGFTSHAVSGAAKLGPLRDNGGPTPTMAPAPDSPLLGAGDAAVCTAVSGAGAVDQRGVVRPQAPTGCDIGAVETIATTTAVVLSPGAAVSAGGIVSLQITVVAADDVAGSPDGTVTVYDGSSSLGTASLVSATGATALYAFTTGALDAGTHMLRAAYGATSLFRGSEATADVTAAAGVTTTRTSEAAAPPATTTALAATGGSPLLPIGGAVLVGSALAVIALRRRRVRV
jgi:hypothetical protein